MKDKINLKGTIKLKIDHDNGKTEERIFHNLVLDDGKVNIAKCLAGEVGTSFTLYICKMLFGNNGTVSGVPKFVNSSRSGLFGVTTAEKSVIATINPSNPSQVLFTAILTGSEANGVLNEMALQMADGTVFSMVTFPDITKTSTMQLTWVWDIEYL